MRRLTQRVFDISVLSVASAVSKFSTFNPTFQHYLQTQLWILRNPGAIHPFGALIKYFIIFMINEYNTTTHAIFTFIIMNDLMCERLFQNQFPVPDTVLVSSRNARD